MLEVLDVADLLPHNRNHKIKEMINLMFCCISTPTLCSIPHNIKNLIDEDELQDVLNIISSIQTKKGVNDVLDFYASSGSNSYTTSAMGQNVIIVIERGRPNRRAIREALWSEGKIAQYKCIKKSNNNVFMHVNSLISEQTPSIIDETTRLFHSTTLKSIHLPTMPFKR